MDKIKIKRLEVFAYHGVFPEENEKGQKFIISATLFCETRKAGLIDDLTKSIHYGEVSHMMEKFIRKNMFQLIETVVERLAEKMLIEIPRLKKVKLELEKPEAPIGLPLETVSIEIEREWHTAYISLGSNIGDKNTFLEAGVEILADTKGCIVEKVSEFIVTEPYGGVKQEEFLNGVLKLRTLLSPEELLSKLQEIEQENGRERSIRWGPRTLDLDIILYDDIVIDNEKLSIPHIEMHKRSFVLEPLAQIAPHLRHPLYGETIVEMLDELKQSGDYIHEENKNEEG